MLGSGAFPTSAASNPTNTIAALALRALAAIQRSMLDGAPTPSAHLTSEVILSQLP